MASFHQGIANIGSWLQFSRDGASNTWQAGMSSDDSYVVRASDATDTLSVSQNGDATIVGHLDFGSGVASKIKVHAVSGYLILFMFSVMFARPIIC